MSSRGLALFDFDGTLVKGDSFREFIQYMAGKPAMAKGFMTLAPWLIGYAAGWISNHRAKEKVTKYYFTGYEEKKFLAKAEQFAREALRKIEIPEAMQAMNKHKNRDDRVIIVSASFEAYVKPWATLHNVEAIGTRLEVVEDRITGSFASPNCYGEEKVIRIQQLLNLSEYHPVYAYGDTQGDLPMLALADQSFYKVF